MLARSTSVMHRLSGIEIHTPILIPSFSSRGFNINRFHPEDSFGSPVNEKAHNVHSSSELANVIQFASEFLTRTCLISAYDIHFGYLPPPDDLPLNLDLIFLDSGGYEVSSGQDYLAVINDQADVNTWDISMLHSVLERWPDNTPAVFISFDHPEYRMPLIHQIGEAQRSFQINGQHLNLFLLKPETEHERTLTRVLVDVIADPEQIAIFDIVGVTEKELGQSLIDRMINIAKLRQSMDSVGLTAPIHVFGALDPISVYLYFVSGAEIFDGLTWLRYGYDTGRCVYIHNFSALNYGLHIKDHQARALAMTSNIYALETIEHRMRTFVDTHDYSNFAPHEELIKEAVESLKAVMKGGF